MPRPSKSARVTRRSALPIAISSLLGLTFASGLALAQSAGEVEFKQCVGNLQAKAVEQGISKQVVDDVLGQVRYQEKVIELDSKQPEFTQTFADYFGRRVTEDRVEKGREMLKEHRDILKRVERETGVPAHYLVAFWGLETNFGSYFGNMPIPASLTTLACDPRRSAYFTEELFAALKIIDAGDVQADNMQGSWAGAMGHVQFMPSVFLRHAVDADGDGRRDLWGSVPDAMASAGNFLKALGWVPGLRWGREVQLPDVFSYSLAGRDESYPVSEWKEFGVKDAFGRPLPNADVEASLLVPSGHRGPAFLVYQNFEIIMRWNRSEFYALAVGRLADRIAGAGPLQTPLPENELQLTRDKVRSMQSYLNMLGFEAGEADGVMGPATRKALSRFQRAEDMVADGYPTQEVLDAMDFDQIQRVQQDQQERAQRKQAKD